MANIWHDSLLPKIVIPQDLESSTFKLGDARFKLLPSQYEALYATEEHVGIIGGLGSGKTNIGGIWAAHRSVYSPGNRGIIAMYASTDLEATAQRDTMEFLRQTGLLEKEPNARTKSAYIKCLDYKTMGPVGATSEIEFVHYDDPLHLKGRHLGWFWMDETQKAKNKQAWTTLVGRLRLPSYKGRYQSLSTGNSGGRDWMFDLFFNQELLEAALCSNPRHTHNGITERNACIRKSRRGIHATSHENYFLPPDYIDTMMASFTEDEIQREIEASFDNFHGMIHREWNHDVHVLYKTPWPDDIPPQDWERVLAWDIGGATAHNMSWGAIDPFGNIVFYDEINEITTDVRALAEKALPKMKSSEREYKFRFKVLDYENRIAGEDMRRAGILFTDAVKTRKMDSVHRFSGYLHPNPKHHYPDYHPRAGLPGSPRAFFTTKCRTAIKEIPQQRWKENQTGSNMKDEPDRDIRHDAWDCCLYICRLLPDPSKLKVDPGDQTRANINKMSAMYWEDAAKHREQQRLMPERRTYGVSSRWS